MVKIANSLNFHTIAIQLEQNCKFLNYNFFTEKLKISHDTYLREPLVCPRDYRCYDEKTQTNYIYLEIRII